MLFGRFCIYRSVINWQASVATPAEWIKEGGDASVVKEMNIQLWLDYVFSIYFCSLALPSFFYWKGYFFILTFIGIFLLGMRGQVVSPRKTPSDRE